VANAFIDRELLGRGLVTPVQRIGGQDFVAGTGEAAIRSAIAQIIGTRRGELPWKPSFGTNLDRFRHKNISSFMIQDIVDEVQDAISKWEPRVSVQGCRAMATGNVIVINISWVILSGAQAGSNIIVGPIDQEVTL
jgi:phage baseplate assembly protein W